VPVAAAILFLTETDLFRVIFATAFPYAIPTMTSKKFGKYRGEGNQSHTNGAQALRLDLPDTNYWVKDPDNLKASRRREFMNDSLSNNKPRLRTTSEAGRAAQQSARKTAKAQRVLKENHNHHC
jgi:hypothetical protein